MPERRIDKVLAALRNSEWVSTAELENAEVGGTQGTRRLRELRANGYRIIQRRKQNSTQFEYHLLTDADVAAGAAITENAAEAIVTYMKEPTPYAQPRSGRHIADGSYARRHALGGALPFVAWHGDTSRGFTARFRGHSMSVRPFWMGDTWTWVVTRPTGKQEYGTAEDLIAAKRAATEVAL